MYSSSYSTLFLSRSLCVQLKPFLKHKVSQQPMVPAGRAKTDKHIDTHMHTLSHTHTHILTLAHTHIKSQIVSSEASRTTLWSQSPCLDWLEQVGLVKMHHVTRRLATAPGNMIRPAVCGRAKTFVSKPKELSTGGGPELARRNQRHMQPQTKTKTGQ